MRALLAEGEADLTAGRVTVLADEKELQTFFAKLAGSQPSLTYKEGFQGLRRSRAS